MLTTVRIRNACDPQGASWFNASEIDQVVDVVRSLLDPADSGLSTPPVQKGEIGVMAAYREQVWRIRERLRADGFGAVDVGSVEVRPSKPVSCPLVDR